MNDQSPVELRPTMVAEMWRFQGVPTTELKNGLYEKFELSRSDGSSLDPSAKYFVINLKKSADLAAFIIWLAVQQAIGNDVSQLSDDLEKAVSREELMSAVGLLAMANGAS